MTRDRRSPAERAPLSRDRRSPDGATVPRPFPAVPPSGHGRTRIAIITGGNRGLGRGTALQLAAAGVDVLLTYRSNAEEADEVVAAVTALGRKALALPLDTGDTASFGPFVGRVRALLAGHWGRDTADFLVNNAGAALAAPFAETTEAQFDEVLDVHLKGVFFLTQRLAPVLADGGSVINVSSALTRFTYPGQSVYALAKSGVETLTRYLARELGERRITVNVVAPGPIATDFAGGFSRDEQFQASFAPQVALGRVGRPDDVGGVIASLLTGPSRWVTGERIEVSGGTLL